MVMVVRNTGQSISAPLQTTISILEKEAIDYEIVVVDNGSDDETFSYTSKEIEQTSLPNTLLVRLLQEVDIDAAIWLGIEHSIGDIVITIPSDEDNPSVLRQMIGLGHQGKEFALAHNTKVTSNSIPYGLAKKILERFVLRNSSSLRRCYLLSRRLVGFLQQHSQPHLALRQLARGSSLRPTVIRYNDEPMFPRKRNLHSRLTAGVRYLLWRNPSALRLSTLASLTGGVLSLFYACYVVIVLVSDASVQPGWASTSLQFSLMFLLVSLSLFVIGENVLLSVSNSGNDPTAFVIDERISKSMGRRGSLSIRQVSESNDN